RLERLHTGYGGSGVDPPERRMIRIAAAQSMTSVSADSAAPATLPKADPARRAALPAPPVEIAQLGKVYAPSGRSPAKTALDGVDLAIPRGSLFGLLGPNGAGKSTLINILAGLVVKTAGRASIWGIDLDAHPRQARAAIGVVPQELN